MLFLTKLIILGILFSTVVNAAFVAKPLILGILPCLLASGTLFPITDLSPIYFWFIILSF